MCDCSRCHWNTFTMVRCKEKSIFKIFLHTAAMWGPSGKHHVCDNQRRRPAPISATASSCSDKDNIIRMSEMRTFLRLWGFMSHCVTPKGHCVTSIFSAPGLISDKVYYYRGNKLSFRKWVLLACYHRRTRIVVALSLKPVSMMHYNSLWTHW